MLHPLVSNLAIAFVLCSSCLLAQEAKIENINVDGKNLSLKVPANPAPGNPWLWIGEFGGHLGALEDGLVSKGWHVA